MMLVGLAALLRVWPLQSLGPRLLYLTLSPAVMVAAVYGGIYAGMLAIALSVAVALFLGPLLVGVPFIQGSADYLGMAAFVVTGTMISLVAESMRGAKSREREYAEEESESRIRQSELLARSTQALLQCRTEDEVLNAIEEVLSKFLPEAIVIVNLITEDGEHLQTRRVTGLGDSMMLRAAEFAGFEILGRVNPLVPEHHQSMLTGRLTQVSDGFAGFASSQMSAAVAESVERFFEIGDVYTIGITDQHEVLGSIHILTRTRSASLPASSIESFLHQCFVVLKNIEHSQGLADSQANLQDTVARLDLALGSADMGAWQYDIIEDRRVFDDRTCRLLGIEPATFAGTAEEFFSVIHPGDVDQVRAALERTIAEDVPYQPEYRVVWPEGDVHWISSRGRLSRDREGRPARIRGVIWDATERTRAEEEIIRQKDRIAQTLTSVIDIAHNIVELRDPYTAGHQRRVSEISVKIAEGLGMSGRDVDDIRVASLLHDVGKVVIPSEILSKPGAISAPQFELLKTHAEAGYRILVTAHMEEQISELVYQHHERCDGSGYPRGLTRDTMLRGAKVIAVADVVEAMASHRPYRPACGIDAALAEIEDGAGTRYDPDVARVCIAMFREQGFELAEL